MNRQYRTAANEPAPCAAVPRREFLSWVGNGLSSAALASLMLDDRSLHAAAVPGDAADAPPHLPPQAPRDPYLPVRRHEPRRHFRP